MLSIIQGFTAGEANTHNWVDKFHTSHTNLVLKFNEVFRNLQIRTLNIFSKYGFMLNFTDGSKFRVGVVFGVYLKDLNCSLAKRLLNHCGLCHGCSKMSEILNFDECSVFLKSKRVLNFTYSSVSRNYWYDGLHFRIVNTQATRGPLYI